MRIAAITAQRNNPSAINKVRPKADIASAVATQSAFPDRRFGPCSQSDRGRRRHASAKTRRSGVGSFRATAPTALTAISTQNSARRKRVSTQSVYGGGGIFFRLWPSRSARLPLLVAGERRRPAPSSGSGEDIGSSFVGGGACLPANWARPPAAAGRLGRNGLQAEGDRRQRFAEAARSRARRQSRTCR